MPLSRRGDGQLGHRGASSRGFCIMAEDRHGLIWASAVLRGDGAEAARALSTKSAAAAFFAWLGRGRFSVAWS